MTVLHISGATSWGGNEQQLLDIIPDLHNLNVKNIIFGVAQSPLHIKCLQNNIQFIHSNTKKLNKLYNYKYLKKIIKRIKPNLIHLHTSNAITVFTISDLLYKLNTPTVFSKKGIGSKMSWLSLFKYNYKSISKIICVSEFVKEKLKVVLKLKNHDKLCVIHDCIRVERGSVKNHLNLREKYAIKNDKTIICNLANHTKAKDLDTFIDIANTIINDKKINDVCFLQIGSESKLTEDFLSRIKEHKLEEHIIFTGFLDDALNLLDQIDIFLITSEREGGPSSVFEAMLKRKPVVSTRVGVIPEIIEHKRNGLISPIKDVNQLSLGIDYLLKNPKKQEEFANLSYNNLKNNFTSKQVASKLFKLYEDVLVNEN